VNNVSKFADPDNPNDDYNERAERRGHIPAVVRPLERLEALELSLRVVHDLLRTLLEEGERHQTAVLAALNRVRGLLGLRLVGETVPEATTDDEPDVLDLNRLPETKRPA
jgi:hypothetical protein